MSTYQWHELYKAALLETDWSKIEERIQAAESAIQNRKRECALDPAAPRRKTAPSRMPSPVWVFSGPKWRHGRSTNRGKKWRLGRQQGTQSAQKVRTRRIGLGDHIGNARLPGLIQ